jgi:hypothetical protein
MFYGRKEMQLQTDWYSSLIDDVKSTWTEAVFTSNWSLVEGYHRVGERLRQEDKRMPITDLLNRCALDMGVSQRKLWYAVQFYDKFPDLNLLPEGKDVNWSRIKAKYLPETVKDKEMMSKTHPKSMMMIIDGVTRRHRECMTRHCQGKLNTRHSQVRWLVDGS